MIEEVTFWFGGRWLYEDLVILRMLLEAWVLVAIGCLFVVLVSEDKRYFVCAINFSFPASFSEGVGWTTDRFYLIHEAIFLQ